MVLKNLFSIYNKKITYFNLVYIFIISVILVLIYSLILYPMFILGFLTLIFLIGAVILLLSIFAVRLFALFDRIVLNLTLNSDIHEPDHSRKTDMLTYIKEAILSRSTWYDMIYLVVVKQVLGVFMFIFSLVLIVLSVALIVIGIQEMTTDAILISYIAKGMIISILGFFLLTLSLHAINFLMEKYVKIARFFLHDSEQGEKQSRRKEDLMKYSSNLHKREDNKDKSKNIIKSKATKNNTTETKKSTIKNNSLKKSSKK